MKDKKTWYEAKQMSQDKAINFACHFYPFGKSLLFSTAKPKIWPAIWLLAGCYFEPERVDFSLFITAPPHMLNC